MNLNWCILEFPRDWSKSPFPKDGLDKCSTGGCPQNMADLINDIYGSVMYSPAAVKTRMTSLVAAAEEFSAYVTCHKLV